MQESDFPNRTLYISFLEQIGSKALKRILERIPATQWGELQVPNHYSLPLQTFKEAFWREVTKNWESGARVRLRTVAEATNRTPRYWSGFFKKYPGTLCWILEPIDTLTNQEPLIRGILVKTYRLLHSELRTSRGIRSKDARVLARFLELVFAGG